MRKILFAAIIMASVAASAQVRRGDVNGDGEINTSDVVAIYNIIINGDEKKPVAFEKRYSLRFSDDMLKVANLRVSYIDTDNNVVREEVAVNSWRQTLKSASPFFAGSFPAARVDNAPLGISLDYTARNDFDTTEEYDIGLEARMDYVITYDDGSTVTLPALNINPQTPAIEGEYVDNAMNAMCQTATAARDYDPENDNLQMSYYWYNTKQGYIPDPDMGGENQLDPGTLFDPMYGNYEWVDLGLPSGRKWATRNVGASTPYEPGGLYGWGDATGYHTEANNRYYYMSRPDTAYISHTRMDIATVQWGPDWRIPSKEEAEELIDNCTYERETVEGCEGVWFKSKINGQRIFMPCAGDRYVENIRSITPDRAYGYYWTANLYPTDNAAAYAFHWDGFTNMYKPAFKERYFGCSIRPVKVEK